MDGFHFSLNSQTIFQNKDVTSDYQCSKPATPKKFHGEVQAPVFPGFYAAWKKNKLAVSFGFNPIGGGGGAEFNDGLPSMELSIADLVPDPCSLWCSGLPAECLFQGYVSFFRITTGCIL